MADCTKTEISREDLEDLSTPASASITGVRHLSSYNWIEAPKATPTIAVPGSPNLWSPPECPLLLKKDHGRFYIAQNAARHPESPLEPLFRALYLSHPSFDIRSIDIITDRNNIRKLLAFINPRWSKYKKEEFTINIEVTSNTAIFCRDGTKTTQYIAPNQFGGYGHTFGKTYTSRQIRGSTGHHRIISYHFGGLNILLRHETDGYVSTIGEAPKVDNLSGVLQSLSLSSESSSKLVIQNIGQEVLLDSTLEIKTRAAHKPLRMGHVMSQLWASQTPKLVRAHYDNGLFPVPEVEDVVVQVKAWEDQNQKDLKQLAGLIGKIRELVKNQGGRAVLKYDVKQDKLYFIKSVGRRCCQTNCTQNGKLTPHCMIRRPDARPDADVNLLNQVPPLNIVFKICNSESSSSL